MWLILAIALSLAFVTESPATTVVAIWTPSAVTIGADSKSNVFDALGADTKVPKVCKIYVSNKGVWSSAGLTKSGLETGSFRLDEIVEATLLRDGSLNDRISSFQVSLGQKLISVAQFAKQLYPAFYAERMKDKPIVQLVFAFIEDREPTYYRWDFAVEDDASGMISVYVNWAYCPGPHCSQNLAASVLGRSEIIKQRAAQNPRMWESANPKTVISSLIEAEIEDAPNDVGAPIAIIEVASTGIRWIENGECRSEE